MFNATVAGTSKKYLRSACVNYSRGGRKGGRRFNINDRIKDLGTLLPKTNEP